MGYELDIFIDPIDPEFLCTFCNHVLDNPILTSDENVIGCASCVDELPYTDEQKIKHRLAPAQFLVQLGGLRVRCRLTSYGCTCILALSKLDQHLTFCGHAKECSDMSDILEHMAFLEVDDEKAILEDIINTARVSLPDILDDSNAPEELLELVIHYVSLSLFAGFDFLPIQESAETSLRQLCPEYSWSVNLRVEEELESQEDKDKDENKLMDAPSCDPDCISTDESESMVMVVHIRFGKLHTITKIEESSKYKMRMNTAGISVKYLQQEQEDEVGVGEEEFKAEDFDFGNGFPDMD